jgi:hypothetical protein
MQPDPPEGESPDLRHDEAADKHDADGRRHDLGRYHWASRGDSGRGDLDSRDAAIDREAAEVDRDRARLERNRRQDSRE